MTQFKVKMLEPATKQCYQEPDSVSNCEHYPSLELIQHILSEGAVNASTGTLVKNGGHVTAAENEENFNSCDNDSGGHLEYLSYDRSFTQQNSTTSNSSAYLMLTPQGSVKEMDEKLEQSIKTSVLAAQSSDEYLERQINVSNDPPMNQFEEYPNIYELNGFHSNIEETDQNGGCGMFEAEDTRTSSLYTSESLTIDEESWPTSDDGYIDNHIN